jgi:hypothetical protein
MLDQSHVVLLLLLVVDIECAQVTSVQFEISKLKHHHAFVFIDV